MSPIERQLEIKNANNMFFYPKSDNVGQMCLRIVKLESGGQQLPVKRQGGSRTTSLACFRDHIAIIIILDTLPTGPKDHCV